MPIKIILYAKDMAMGTEVVTEAMAMGAALAEFVEAKAPIKAKAKPKAKAKAEKKKRKIVRTPHSATYDFDDNVDHTATKDSPRHRAYAVLKTQVAAGTRSQMIADFKLRGLVDDGQAKSCFSYFKKHGVIKLTPTLLEKVDDVVAGLGTFEHQ